MNAIVLVRQGAARKAFEFRSMPDPVPGRGEVRIAVETSGLNFADVLARQGLYKDTPPLPCVLGYDVVGRIDAVGDEVYGLRPGMRVVAMTRFGGYASKAIARTYGVVRVPESIEDRAAITLGTQYATAWFAAMEMVRLNPDDRVIIHAAAGGVGSALVELAKLCGCVVFGTTGSMEKVHYLKSIGVDYPICTRGSGFAQEFSRLSPDRGADVIFDSIGGSGVRQGLRLLSAGGRIVCYGASAMSGPPPQLPRLIRTLVSFGLTLPINLLLQSKGIIGINLLRVGDERPDIIQRCMRSVLEMARQGRIHPHVGHCFPAARIADAHELMESRGSTGKIALCWENTPPPKSSVLSLNLLHGRPPARIMQRRKPVTKTLTSL